MKRQIDLIDGTYKSNLASFQGMIVEKLNYRVFWGIR